MSDRVGLNLLYMQTVQDVERGWILTNHEIQRQLAALQAKGAKKEVQCICGFELLQSSR